MDPRWASSISDLPDLDHALAAALDDLSVESPDLVLAFVAGHPRSSLGRLPHLIRERFPRALLLGSSAGGVLGGGLEIEGRAAVALTAARLPGAELVPFHVENVLAHDPVSLRRASGPADALLMLPDPFSIDAPALVASFDQALPEAIKVGGIASGGQTPGAIALYLGEATHASGAVGVAMRGVKVDTLVAQGCRPIGDAMFVTRHRGHVIHELNGKPVVSVLRELHESLSPGDQELFKSSLFLGVGFDDKREYRQGDFLIRNIGGLQSQGLVVSASFSDYAVVQFHVRDAKTSAEDLENLLAREREAARARPAGALLFSCLGRGQGLYGVPNHDSDAFHRALGDVPLGGFFCNGEIGPIGGRTFLHGYTSSFALFR
ncbi:MAG: FIST signal transduction protein [Polyangiales bacterium]